MGIGLVQGHCPSTRDKGGILWLVLRSSTEDSNKEPTSKGDSTMPMDDQEDLLFRAHELRGRKKNNQAERGEARTDRSKSSVTK